MKIASNPSNRSNEKRNRLEEELKHPPKEKPSVQVDTDILKREALNREKKQPLFQKIAKKITKRNTPFREIVINIEPLETRVAQIKDGILDSLEIERHGEERIVNGIFKGKIQNLDPGLKAAFVDIGMVKNAFLHYWDVLPAANESKKDNSIEFVRDTRSAAQKDKSSINIKDIPKLYPIGSEIIVQVTKAQIGSKGPRTTTSIALPGKFLVLMPYSGQCGISRKIESQKERRRLKKILRELTIPEGMGVIIRTAGESKKLRYFIRDFHLLLQTWETIQKRIKENKNPCALYHESDLLERTVRDLLTEDIDRLLVDDEEGYKKMIENVALVSPRSRSKITLFTESIPIFERFNIERQIEQTYQRRVPLPSGGEIVIEETEALIAIDINTGSHKSRKDEKENVIFQVNTEASYEIARQIRLRNIGGLIILDFIDMKSRKDRNTILKIMRQEMSKDKAKCHILPVSPLGIMQMTRQRHEESMASGLYSDCFYCSGRGIVKSPRTMSAEIQRRLISIVRRLRLQESFGEKVIQLRILCHPTVFARMRDEDKDPLMHFEALYNARLFFKSHPNYHIENFKILDYNTEEEIR